MYNNFSNEEAMLVSFGNFLFDRYGVMVFSNDGRNTPIYKREVTDADICNWKDFIEQMEKEMKYVTSDEYDLKHGDLVKVFLMPEGESEFPGINGRVTAINDKLTKLTYDVELVFAGGFKSRIHNVDSVLVKKLTPQSPNNS
jgi:hypothetical protein